MRIFCTSLFWIHLKSVLSHPALLVVILGFGSYWVLGAIGFTGETYKSECAAVFKQHKRLLTKLALGLPGLTYDIKKVTLVLWRERARLHSVWLNICLSFYTRISFNSEQCWTRKHSTKYHPWEKKSPRVLSDSPKQLVCNLLSNECATAIGNVTCYHHTFKSWRQFPESRASQLHERVGFKCVLWMSPLCKSSIYSLRRNVGIIQGVQMQVDLLEQIVQILRIWFYIMWLLCF